MKIGVLAYRFDYYTNLRNIIGKLPEVDYVQSKIYTAICVGQPWASIAGWEENYFRPLT
jgi:hypothetical protein